MYMYMWLPVNVNGDAYSSSVCASFATEVGHFMVETFCMLIQNCTAYMCAEIFCSVKTLSRD